MNPGAKPSGRLQGYWQAFSPSLLGDVQEGNQQ